MEETMPLLTSPISGEPMKQISRYGIEIDICPTTGGVWLDKGELEKLMAMIREAAAQEQSNYSPPPQQQQAPQYQQQQYREPRREERYDQQRYQQSNYDNRQYDNKHGYKKKGRFSDILDIFDF